MGGARNSCSGGDHASPALTSPCSVNARSHWIGNRWVITRLPSSPLRAHRSMPSGNNSTPTSKLPWKRPAARRNPASVRFPEPRYTHGLLYAFAPSRRFALNKNLAWSPRGGTSPKIASGVAAGRTTMGGSSRPRPLTDCAIDWHASGLTYKSTWHDLVNNRSAMSSSTSCRGIIASCLSLSAS